MLTCGHSAQAPRVDPYCVKTSVKYILLQYLDQILLYKYGYALPVWCQVCKHKRNLIFLFTQAGGAVLGVKEHGEGNNHDKI